MPSKNDFDAEEREFASRVRLPQCPDFALLYSAHEGVLPDDQAAQVRTHMSACEICTRLFEDFDSIDFGAPTAIEAAQIRDRIQRQAPRAFDTRRPPASWIRRRWWVPALGLAASAAAAVFLLHPAPPARTTGPQIAETRPMPEVPLEKLAIHVDASALLATRGVGDSNHPSAADLAKGLRRYQNDDYAGAAQQLKALAQKYPRDGTVRLYLGISELFLDRNDEAAEDLKAAQSANDGGRLADSEWYLGIAELRRKQATEALPLFGHLCEGKSGYSQRACEIESQLK
jgi:TolA-binding protein